MLVIQGGGQGGAATSVVASAEDAENFHRAASSIASSMSTTTSIEMPILLDRFYWTDAEKPVVHEGLNSKAKYVVTNIDWGPN